MVVTGRTSQLTDELIEHLKPWIDLASYNSTIADAAGVESSTVQAWLANGRRDFLSGNDTVYARFFDRLTQARAHWERDQLEKIEQAALGGAVISEITRTRKDGSTEIDRRYAPPDANNNRWLLERKMPDKYGRQERQKVDLTAEIKGMTIADISLMVSQARSLKSDKDIKQIDSDAPLALSDGQGGE